MRTHIINTFRQHLGDKFVSKIPTLTNSKQNPTKNVNNSWIPLQKCPLLEQLRSVSWTQNIISDSKVTNKQGENKIKNKVHKKIWGLVYSKSKNMINLGQTLHFWKVVLKISYFALDLCWKSFLAFNGF